MLSVLIIAWNEEKNIPRVVGPVKGLADEVIVVDTQSSDNTVEVAKKLGCKVYSHPYPGIVEPVRNFAVTKAKGDWILFLDADEEVTPKLAEKIKTVLASNSADYVRIPRKNIIFNHWIRSSHWWPDFVYRLFRKGYVVWSDAIHSIPQTRGNGMDLTVDEDLALVHHHYETVSQYVQRIDRYTDHQLKLLVKENIRFNWPMLVTKPVQEFINQYFSRGGFKDGLHGLALSLLQSFSELVLYLKLWQHEKFTEVAVSPGDFYKVISIQSRDFLWWYYEVRIRTANFITLPFFRFVRKMKLSLGLR